MKIGIYNPYLDSMGGGERYSLTLASYWSKKHSVDIFWDSAGDIAMASERFGLDLSEIHITGNIFIRTQFLQKLSETRKYDCIFFVSDGSIPTSLARRNIIHFQVPFARVYFPLWKKYMFQRIVVNSEFTGRYLDHSVTVGKTVIYPPVPLLTGGLKKTKSILSVGRFGGLYNTKKYDVLIHAFREMVTIGGLKGWKLLLAGNVLPTDREKFVTLKNLANGLPVEFYPDCPLEKLSALYKTASVYWHGAGYSETRPEHMEHFGMTTVEAMSAGCVPVSYNGGGQSEIIKNGKDGYLWETPGELQKITEELIKSHHGMKTMSMNAVKKSAQFSTKRFTDAFDRLLEELK